MAATAPKQLYNRLIARWPVDALRPQLQFQATLHARLDRDFDNDSTKLDAIKEANLPKPAKGQPPIEDPIKQSTVSSEAQWDALSSLLENKYLKYYPITSKTTEPVCNPEYYAKLVHELDEAPKRSWLGSYINSWRGYVRWQ